MRYPKLPLPFAAAALLAALAACGPATPATPAAAPTPSANLPGFVPSGMASMPGMAPPASDSAQPSTSSAPVGTSTVVIRGFAFAPATVTVRVGTTVTWTNSDQDAHTVTATGGEFRSPTLGTGDTYHVTFTKPGRYDYLCTIHPFMTATVVVTG